MVQSKKENISVDTYMITLQEVKISLAKIDEQIKSLTDFKAELTKIVDVVNETYYITKQHEKDINELKQKTKDIVENDKKKWGAIFTVAAAFFFQVIYFLLTYHFNKKM